LPTTELSAHAIGLTLVAVIAITAIGLAGTDVSWLHVLGTSSGTMIMSH
jgi:hypothetical protein